MRHARACPGHRRRAGCWTLPRRSADDSTRNEKGRGFPAAQFAGELFCSVAAGADADAHAGNVDADPAAIFIAAALDIALARRVTVGVALADDDAVVRRVHASSGRFRCRPCGRSGCCCPGPPTDWRRAVQQKRRWRRARLRPPRKRVASLFILSSGRGVSKGQESRRWLVPISFRRRRVGADVPRRGSGTFGNSTGYTFRRLLKRSSV